MGLHGDADAGSLVLVIDDDAALAEMLQLVLRREGLRAQVHHEGRRALEVFRETRPDLVLLDLMLPGRSGIDVCRDIRSVSGVPIIMLTAKSDTADVVAGLDAGADDYVSKPFKGKELIARIRTRLRRRPPEVSAPELMLDDVVVNVVAHTVMRGGQAINLTPSSSTC